MAATIINAVPELRYLIGLIDKAPGARRKLRYLDLLNDGRGSTLLYRRFIGSINALLLRRLFPEACQIAECPLDLFDEKNQTS
jgi:hypothetical protein